MSSANLTRLTRCLSLHRLVGNFLRRVLSNPSSVIFVNTGEAMPPCGTPSSVVRRVCRSMNPALSHFFRMDFSIGICSRSQEGEILSKQDFIWHFIIHSVSFFGVSA